ncbi:hypothetical protein AKJ16_DCAP20490, partial [Drosera capensis]
CSAATATLDVSNPCCFGSASGSTTSTTSRAVIPASVVLSSFGASFAAADDRRKLHLLFSFGAEDEITTGVLKKRTPSKKISLIDDSSPEGIRLLVLISVSGWAVSASYKVIVHCKAGDSDLGRKVLYPGQGRFPIRHLVPSF